MAKLSGANLPDWLAQWAMNRGAIEDPSASSASSSGLFDQPMIRRRRPEMMDDERDDSWMNETSPVLDSYPTSWADVGRDLSNIPGQFMEDITEFGNSLIDGASGMFKDAGESIEKSNVTVALRQHSQIKETVNKEVLDNALVRQNPQGDLIGRKEQKEEERGLLGTINQLPDTIMRGLIGDTAVNFLDKAGKKGSTGSFMRGANDKTLPMSARVAGGLGAGMSLLMPGIGATGVGLFGGIANAMGFHHDFDPRYESNLSYNPEAGRISWDSASQPGGGGHQYGDLNNQNFFEANPDQYFNVDGLGYRRGQDLAKKGIETWPTSANVEAFYDRSLFNPPFGFQDFGMGDHNVTNQQALGQYNFDGTGAIQNEAGAVAERSNVGYNRQQTIADVIADFTNEGIDMDWDGTEASDFSGVGDDGLSFDWSDDDWTL